MRNLRKFWKKKKDTWLGTLIYIIFGFFLALLFNSVLCVVLDTDTPVVAVFSNSMVPAFYKGDMIVVSGSDEYDVGDVIVFDSDIKTYPIVHRIYETDGENISTKGDNNNDKDPWTITAENIHGKMILKIPLLGWVKIIFTDITGFG